MTQNWLFLLQKEADEEKYFRHSSSDFKNFKRKMLYTGYRTLLEWNGIFRTGVAPCKNSANTTAAPVWQIAEFTQLGLHNKLLILPQDKDLKQEYW